MLSAHKLIPIAEKITPQFLISANVPLKEFLCTNSWGNSVKLITSLPFYFPYWNLWL